MKGVLLILLLSMLLVGAFLFTPEREAIEGEVFQVENTVREVENSPTLLFVGDMMFDRYIRRTQAGSEYKGTLETLTALLDEHDVVIGNLEGPITSYSSVSVDTSVGEQGNTRFTFPPEVAKFLSQTGFSLVSLANNHTLDFGTSGMEQTKQFLREESVGYFGTVGEPFLDMLIGSQMIRFVGYSEFGAPTINDAKSAIEEASSEVFVIVFVHWGEEYVASPPARVVKTARAFVDEGADLIIGAHPHVVQELESYKGVKIYYSLGNFIFDQYWSEEVRKGKIVSVELGDTPEYTEYEIELLRDGTTAFVAS